MIIIEQGSSTEQGVISERAAADRGEASGAQIETCNWHLLMRPQVALRGDDAWVLGT